MHIYLRLRGGGPVHPEFGIAAGGLINQTIVRDEQDPSKWEPSSGTTFNVQILNSEIFEEVTGLTPPPTPVTAAEYSEYGYPYYSIYDETPSDVQGNFAGVQSVNQLDQTGAPSDEKTQASSEVTESTINPVVFLEVDGKPRGFRTLADLEKEVREHFGNLVV